MTNVTELHTPQDGLAAVVADNIRAEAARRRIRQEDLAPAVGISRAAVSDRYRGRTPWTLQEIDRAASLFGMRPVDLCATKDSNLEPTD